LDPDPDLDPDPYWPPTSSSGSGSGSVKNEYGSTTLVEWTEKMPAKYGRILILILI
jgi:hypothetical protein